MDNKGESSSSHQVYPADAVYAPATPAKPVGSENMASKEWLRTPFDEALFEDTPANKNFSCWERNFGSTMSRVSINDAEIWNIPCRDLLALADASVSLKPYNNFLSDLNEPPPPETDVITQFIPVTPDQAGKAANVHHQQPQIVIEQSQEADSSTIVQSNQECEKGLSEQINLNETPQQTKQRRRKHRPKVIKERKPRAKKPQTPKPDGSSTGKRKYVRKKPVEKSPIAEGEIIDLTTDEQQPEQPEKSCKRKINFDEVEVEVEATQVDDKTCPITPAKTESQQQGRSQSQSSSINKAKCRINFVQETHEKAAISVSSPNESNCSTSANLSNQKIDGSMEAYLSAYTNYNIGVQLPVIYNNKIIETHHTSITSVSVVPNVNKSPGECSSQASNKKRVKRTKGVTLVNELGQPIAKPNKRVKKTSFVCPLYNNQLNFANKIVTGCNIIWEVEGLIRRFERLEINDNAIVPFQGHGSVVPYEGLFNPIKKRKPRPKVDLDEETDRVWRLLLEDINSQGVDGTDEDKAKWWEEERRVFRGRAESFIARMHLVQGDRRFSRWKGSVLDSVIGVFLTQNVSDHLSSSAFMSLVSRYPYKPKNTSEEVVHEENDSVLSVVQEPSEVIENSCEKSQQAYTVDLNENSECGVDDVISSQNSTNTSPSSVQSSIAQSHITEEQQKDTCQARVENGYTTSFVELLHMQGSSTTNNGNCCEKTDLPKECGSEESGLSSESASVQTVKTVISEKTCEVRQVFDKVIEFNSGSSSQIVEGDNNNKNKGRYVDKVRVGKKQAKVNWDKLRLQAEVEGTKKERSPLTMDALDYEALMNADVNDIADAIKERGMNNVLATRIKALLDRVVADHGSVDLEWLRDVPPDKAKEYLLSFRGLGLKSVECVRLLTLHHLAFPVDTNVGRIAVRLGWVPLQPLPESLQLHLLELYPVLESIQKYLWPRLCKLDQPTLYELHYQMITFGKVFCTKSRPNCNACPMRGECRHFASAYASARLGLPAPKGSMAALTGTTSGQKLIEMSDQQSQQQSEVQNCNPVTVTVTEEQQTPIGPIVEVPESTTTVIGPIIEQPASPEPIVEVPTTPEAEQQTQDMEDFCEEEGEEEIPMIKLNMEEFTQNLQTYMERHMELGESGMSKALVALTSEAAAIPVPKLKNVSQLRTEHQVYELPDTHPLLEGLDTREPDDPCSYLLAIWTPGETADSIQPPAGQCSSQESGTLCNEETCFFCNSTREANAQTVRGTLLIPCRTAMRGSFPLNGTYFQVNEVFADHDSSLNPIDVPRSWLWNLPRRTVYFGTSIPTIFKGLTTEDIQYCFWRGFVCVRGFDQKSRAPRPLMARLHFPASKREKAKTDANKR